MCTLPSPDLSQFSGAWHQEMMTTPPHFFEEVSLSFKVICKSACTSGASIQETECSGCVNLYILFALGSLKCEDST